jgi:Tfp pilus assembly protein PilN
VTPLHEVIRRRVGGATNIGIGVSRAEVRLVGLNHAGQLVWNRSLSRGRSDTSLADLIGKALADRPAMLRGAVRVACVVGPTEAQLRPLHGLPHLRSATEQLAVVTESFDRFFVSEGARMRMSSPVRARDGEIWAAAVNRDVVNEIAEACRAQRVRLVGVAPVAAALGHLAADDDAAGTDTGVHIQRTDDGTCLHIVYVNGMPARTWRERDIIGSPPLAGSFRLPTRVDLNFADAFAATYLRARDPFVISEHSDDVRRARVTRQRTWLWAGLTVASLVAAAWAPGALAVRRADHARARLATLAPRQRELRQVQTSLAGATTTLNSIAAFESSRRSATLLLAELALGLPDSTAVTTLRVDSLGGTLTLLAPRAASALEAVSALPLMARVQMNGAVTREMAGGVELERASLRFSFVRGKPTRESPARDATARMAIAAERPTRGGTQ